MLVYRIPYYCHPEKTEEWLASQRRRMTKSELAREILISYEYSVEGVVFNNFLESHLIKDAYYFRKDMTLYRALDFGRTNACLFAQRDSMGRWIIFKEIVLCPSDTPSQASVIKSITTELNPQGRILDCCDPAGNSKDHRTNTTDIEICTGNAQKGITGYGINPQFDRIQGVRDRLQAGITLIQHNLMERVDGVEMIRIVEKDCPTLVDAFRSGYRWKQDINGKVLDVIDEEHPYEDVMDCLRYLLMQFAPNQEQKPRVNIEVRPFTPTRNPNYRPSPFSGGSARVGVSRGVKKPTFGTR